MTRIMFSAAGKKANRMACLKGLAHIHDLNAVGRSGGNPGMCQVKDVHIKLNLFPASEVCC